MNGTKERVHCREKSSGLPGLKCPYCETVVQVTGDSQNWGAVRRHLNVHVRAGAITEQQKVAFVKALGI